MEFKDDGNSTRVQRIWRLSQAKQRIHISNVRQNQGIAFVKSLSPFGML